jgi:L-aminopeptidase/D-esterase-like protein
VITTVPGIRVGHRTDAVGLTGCTVVLCPPGTVGSGEVLGGAPGTRETDLLRPGMLVEEVHAVLLTGGSAFGLAAADGVMRYLEERGVGFDAGVARVPIVPAAVLFDLWVGDPNARPGPQEGYEACAGADTAVAEGNVGAGTGATVAGGTVKGGLGTASATEGAVVVGALFAVNALGAVVDDEGTPIAGSPEAAARPPLRPPGSTPSDELPANTTIGVVATNARLSKERAHLLARAGHHGLARAVSPAHTIRDGDTVFTLATGEVDGSQAIVEELAERVVAEAIRRAVRAAESIPGVPAAGEHG